MSRKRREGLQAAYDAILAAVHDHGAPQPDVVFLKPSKPVTRPRAGHPNKARSARLSKKKRAENAWKRALRGENQGIRNGGFHSLRRLAAEEGTREAWLTLWEDFQAYEEFLTEEVLDWFVRQCPLNPPCVWAKHLIDDLRHSKTPTTKPNPMGVKPAPAAPVESTQNGHDSEPELAVPSDDRDKDDKLTVSGHKEGKRNGRRFQQLSVDPEGSLARRNLCRMKEAAAVATLDSELDEEVGIGADLSDMPFMRAGLTSTELARRAAALQASRSRSA